MAEHHRLPLAPVLVIDLGAVFVVNVLIGCSLSSGVNSGVGLARPRLLEQPGGIRTVTAARRRKASGGWRAARSAIEQKRAEPRPVGVRWPPSRRSASDAPANETTSSGPPAPSRSRRRRRASRRAAPSDGAARLDEVQHVALRRRKLELCKRRQVGAVSKERSQQLPGVTGVRAR